MEDIQKDKIHKTIFSALENYSQVNSLSIDSKIANIAYNKMQYIFVELVYKFNGLEYIKKKLGTISDEDFLSFLAFMMLDIDEKLSKQILQKVSLSKNSRIAFKAQHTLNNVEKFKQTVNDVINTNKKKLK